MMKINEKLTIPSLLGLMVLLGLGLGFLYKEYGQQLKMLIVGKDKVEDNTLYFTPESYVFTDGDFEQWLYKIIQVKVVEYGSEGGLNYVVGEYLPYNDKGSEMRQVRILLTRGETWENKFDGLDAGDFEKVVTSEIMVQDTFDLTTINFWNRKMVNLETFKESFKPGSILPMAVVFSYPNGNSEDVLTEELCGIEMYERSCNLTRVWSVVSANQGDFWAGLDMSDINGFYIVPYSFSPYVLTHTEVERMWR